MGAPLFAPLLVPLLLLLISSGGFIAFIASQGRLPIIVPVGMTMGLALMMTIRPINASAPETIILVVAGIAACLEWATVLFSKARWLRSSSSIYRCLGVAGVVAGVLQVVSAYQRGDFGILMFIGGAVIMLGTLGILQVGGRRIPSSVESAWARIDPGVVVHGQPNALAPTYEGLVQASTMLYVAFPDLRVTVDTRIVDGDREAQRLTVRGTHTGVLAGALLDFPIDIEPTGVQVQWTEISICRISDGNIVEIWDSSDRYGLLRQLAVVPDLRW